MGSTHRPECSWKSSSHNHPPNFLTYLEISSGIAPSYICDLPFSAIPLTSHSAALTAWSNDFGFESFFKRQVNAHGNEDDILFLLSTGGGNLTGSKASANLVYAAEEGINKKMKIISLVGKGGGELKKISDICINVESQNTAYIQEAHMSILHCICEMLDNSKV